MNKHTKHTGSLKLLHFREFAHVVSPTLANASLKKEKEMIGLVNNNRIPVEISRHRTIAVNNKSLDVVVPNFDSARILASKSSGKRKI